MTRLAVDDDGGDEVFASSIAMQALEPGVYSIKVRSFDDANTGSDATYTVRIAADTTP